MPLGLRRIVERVQIFLVTSTGLTKPMKNYFNSHVSFHKAPTEKHDRLLESCFRSF